VSGRLGFPATTQYSKKLQVRALREVIKVYAGVGLPDVWTAVNGLNKIAGQAPLPPHKFSAWSFREIISQAGMGARSDGLFHLSDVASLIRNTPPFDSSETGPYLGGTNWSLDWSLVRWFLAAKGATMLRCRAAVPQGLDIGAFRCPAALIETSSQVAANERSWRCRCVPPRPHSGV
jgi:hypothetical protein